jgi:hypothetical protein
MGRFLCDGFSMANPEYWSRMSGMTESFAGTDWPGEWLLKWMAGRPAAADSTRKRA